MLCSLFSYLYLASMFINYFSRYNFAQLLIIRVYNRQHYDNFCFLPANITPLYDILGIFLNVQEPIETVGH